MFKKGDRVIYSGDKFCGAINGGEYTIRSYSPANGVQLEWLRDVSFAERNFKLADSNPMPKLESGMVVEVLLNGQYRKKYLVVKSDYFVGENGFISYHGEHDIVSVSTCGRGTIVDVLNNYTLLTIWQKETEAQKTLRELKELQEETNKKIAELEEVI